MLAKRKYYKLGKMEGVGTYYYSPTSKKLILETDETVKKTNKEKRKEYRKNKRSSPVVIIIGLLLFVSPIISFLIVVPYLLTILTAIITYTYLFKKGFPMQNEQFDSRPSVPYREAELTTYAWLGLNQLSWGLFLFAFIIFLFLTILFFAFTLGDKTRFAGEILLGFLGVITFVMPFYYVDWRKTVKKIFLNEL